MAYRDQVEALRAERDALARELEGFSYLHEAAQLLVEGSRRRRPWRSAALVIGALLCGAAVHEYAGRMEPTNVFVDSAHAFGDHRVPDALVYSIPFTEGVRVLEAARRIDGFDVRFTAPPWSGAAQIAHEHPGVRRSDIREHADGERDPSCAFPSRSATALPSGHGTPHRPHRPRACSLRVGSLSPQGVV